MGEKVALITGGTRGIGRAIAETFASNGYNLALNYMRKKKNAEAVQQELEDTYGITVNIFKANLGEVEQIQQLFTDVKETCGRLDVFISNAASGVLRPVTEIQERHWDWTQDINAKAYVFAAQEAATLMEKNEQGGAIVAISSIGAIRVLPNYVAVGVSKAAVETSHVIWLWNSVPKTLLLTLFRGELSIPMRSNTSRIVMNYYKMPKTVTRPAAWWNLRIWQPLSITSPHLKPV